MRKRAENLLWVLAIVAIAAISLTAPIVIDFLIEWWVVILAWAASVAACATISFLVGVAHGRKLGVSTGYWLRDSERRR